MAGQYNSRNSRKRKKSKAPVVVFSALAIILIAAVSLLILKPFDSRTTATKSGSSAGSQVAAKSSSVAASSATTSASKTLDTSNWLTTNGAPNQLPILMFHYTDEVANNPLPAWNSNYMTPQALDAIAKALKANGYQTLTADEAAAVLTGNKKPSNKMVWLTFDDGHADNYTYTYPILKKYGLHASFGMIAGVLPTYGGADTSYITEKQMKEMKASGVVDFISHTTSHLDLSTLSAADETHEVKDSKTKLDQMLAQNTQVLVYPSGKFNALTESVAKKAGYKIGLEEGEDMATSALNSFEMPRYRMSDGTTPDYVLSLLAPASKYNTNNTPK
ncbi:MAG: polysaccharide deacetylase family protein [Streptococcaceae bacterium]|jgi:peptidoglycan/xylan/chitin deacetylase (PgdA/CDA1 family)|nr:polysaccharide deacetylase family protein [Streptococcaceae bacterium]